MSRMAQLCQLTRETEVSPCPNNTSLPHRWLGRKYVEMVGWSGRQSCGPGLAPHSRTLRIARSSQVLSALAARLEKPKLSQIRTKIFEFQLQWQHSCPGNKLEVEVQLISCDKLMFEDSFLEVSLCESFYPLSKSNDGF